MKDTPVVGSIVFGPRSLKRPGLEGLTLSAPITSKDVLKEIARYLSPQNQNVKNGDIIACIRDLAQIAQSGKDNAKDLERRIEQLEALINPMDLPPWEK